jgi:hypothetical protein
MNFSSLQPGWRQTRGKKKVQVQLHGVWRVRSFRGLLHRALPLHQQLNKQGGEEKHARIDN